MRPMPDFFVCYPIRLRRARSCSDHKCAMTPCWRRAFPIELSSWCRLAEMLVRITAMRFTTGLLSAVVFWALSVVTVHAQKRVALVVGIDRYVNLSAGHQLTTAGYDARLIGDALSRVGFDVIRAQDVGRAAFVAKLGELQRKLTPGDFVFFYFAGHGVSFGGANYILPSDVPDVRAGQEARLAPSALREDDIVADLKRRSVKAAIMV